MFICCLCSKKSRGKLKGTPLDKKITENLTFYDAIKQQISNFQDSESQVSCAACFNCFKSFYDLVGKVNKKLTAVSKSKNPLKVESDLDCSDFEWEDGGMRENDEASVDSETKNDKVKPPQKKKIETQNKSIDKIEAIKTDPDEHQTLNEDPKINIFISADNHEIIKIENCSVQKIQLENSAIPTNSSNLHSDADRRKHPSLDPENEQKIRNFVEVKCHVCNLKLESFSKVKKHFVKNHPDQKGFLICCTKKFFRRAALLDHIEWHDKSKIHRCDICDKEYKNKACLRSHNRLTHSNDFHEAICNICGKTCRNEITLRKHLRTHEMDDTRSFECYICHKPSKNQHLLKTHMQSTHNRAHHQVVCDICSAVVKSRYFRTHMKIHQTNREKFQCELCKRWILLQAKTVHMKNHTDLGVNCQLCGKFLKNSNYLTTHMKTAHSETHRYKCEICDKSYHKKIKLLEHVAARHTREVLFRCRVEGCGKEFRAEGNWKVHEKKYHKEEYERFFKPAYLKGPDGE